MGTAVSESLPVTVGVPQESILGPLLFIIYINDLPLSLKHYKVPLYADDSVIYCSDTSPDNMQSRLNEDLQRLTQWFCTNKLSINVLKCKFMLLGHSSRYGDFSSLSLSISGEDLERVDCYKYLGITLNQRLSWEDHVSNIASKIRKRISILSRIKYMLPISVRLTFYNTMIKPIFEDNSIVWGDERNTVRMDTLQILQNRAAKIILGRDSRDSATQALKDLTG